MPVPFPFHLSRYLSGFPHVGTAEPGRDAPAGVIRRPIAGSDLSDGLGPWPYFHARDAGDGAALAAAFPDLVTVVAITQPGFRPPDGDDAVLLKEHFVHDPDLPATALSRRARKRLRQAEGRWQVDCPQRAPERMELAALYAQVSRRRSFAGGFFDFPPAHFAALAGLDGMVYFRVARDGEAAGMACGARHGDELHLLHLALSDQGLAEDAAYPLMQAIIDFCRERKVVMLMGGAPRTDGEGIARFKRRWTNRSAPVFLTRFVNRPDAYAALCRNRPATAFFPAYRDPREFR
jgi:hypothetical protein